MQHIFAKLGISAIMAGAALWAAPAFAATTAATVTSATASANWAGYVAQSAAPYTAVGSSWVVPAPTATTTGTDATWVGIGGVKSDDLIQAGTQAIVERGQITYQAWYELLPDYQHIIPLAINGGDSVTVSLVETGTNRWHLSFKDTTTGGDYETDITYQSSLSSAEWIEEMPVGSEGRFMAYLPLDNFGTVNFSGAYTIANGQAQALGASGAEPLSMLSGRSVLAAPTMLADNSSFSVARGSAQTATAPARYGTTQAAARGHRGRGGYSISSTGQGAYTIVISF